MRKLVIALGTGRNGSRSLATLMSLQGDIEFYHEFGRLPWDQDISRFNRLMNAFSEYTGPHIIGDTGSWYICYVEMILKRFGSAVKFICLERPIEEVVNSYLVKVVDGNHWTKPGSKYLTGREKPSVFDECYPKFDVPKKEAIESFCRDYKALSDKALIQYPKSFRSYNMSVLWDEQSQRRMLRFAGIPDYQVHICTSVHENKGINFKKYLERI